MKQDSRSYLIHATDWNRLDIRDLHTGNIITERENLEYNAANQDSRYLNYFHCSISVSPNSYYIIDNGWVWHPQGVIVSWSINDWFHNIWESENGSSKLNLVERNYFWQGSICWINHNTVAVWGYGNDDENLIPAVCIFNVETGKMTNWFPDPEGELYYNQYLYACSKEKGTTVWDINTGECLLTDKNLNPIILHPSDNSFLSILPDQTLLISRLTNR